MSEQLKKQVIKWSELLAELAENGVLPFPNPPEVISSFPSPKEGSEKETVCLKEIEA